MALPYFAEFGWEPLILKINPDEQEGIKDPDLCRTVPEHIKTWQAGCLPLWLTKWTGLRNVGLRSFCHLARLGDRIIQTEKPQVVFFSTTMFPLMTLGRYWQRRHGNAQLQRRTFTPSPAQLLHYDWSHHWHGHRDKLGH